MATITARTSVSLLERLRAAPDEAAWRRFVDIYGPLIYRWLTEYGLQDHDARDLGQEVLLTVVREMPTFHYDPGRGSFRGWLRGVLRNRLRAFWRDRRTKPAGWAEGDLETRLDDLVDPGSDVARRWDEEHDRYVAARVLEFLKGEFEPTTWQAFWRTMVDGEKPVVAAAALGITANAVYLARARVLRRLREETLCLLDEPPRSFRS